MTYTLRLTDKHLSDIKMKIIMSEVFESQSLNPDIEKLEISVGRFLKKQINFINTMNV